MARRLNHVPSPSYFRAAMPFALPRVSRRDLSYFFFSQHFSDGLRTTLAILLPAVLGRSGGSLRPVLPSRPGPCA
ncbi:hypothetical protein [Hymenobacter sp. BRD67]|uniref:hypothetical protein n=1 Tax=Hymenobacter sp. BRD67 TaxID=2675877 RepID=UPI001565158D|nr:hypothetical protein [Hymenobacter sp. BRD67]QKG53707.1 hypothetical protein GKZ67_15250 [Hymenobacter sp. BRD67]